MGRFEFCLGDGEWRPGTSLIGQDSFLIVMQGPGQLPLIAGDDAKDE